MKDKPSTFKVVVPSIVITTAPLNISEDVKKNNHNKCQPARNNKRCPNGQPSSVKSVLLVSQMF